MRYLVTGGLGVIGSCIARRLLAAGHEVMIIDACEAPRNLWIQRQLEKLGGDALSIMFARIERYESNIHEKLAICDAVIHCAASTGIPHSVLHPDDDWASNVDATRVLLEALRIHRQPTVVLSSVKPYFVPIGMNEGRGLNEQNVLEPDEPYAASKAAQSMLCMAYARSYDLPIVTFRCSNLYGPAPCHGPRHGWLTWFCISAAIGRPIEIQGTGEQTRDMLHADDVYSACVKALGALNSSVKMAGEVFNLGGGRLNRISICQAARALHEITGVEVHNAPARAMDDDHVYVDHWYFTDKTGWRPDVPVGAGMLQILAWAQEHKDELSKLYEGV